MGRRPSANPKSTQISFRIDAAATAALDREVEADQRPGLTLSRNDVARMLLAEALEARAAKRGKRK